MTTEEWQALHDLCVKALEEIPDHPIAEAVALTGAFAASVIAHTAENN